MVFNLLKRVTSSRRKQLWRRSARPSSTADEHPPKQESGASSFHANCPIDGHQIRVFYFEQSWKDLDDSLRLSTRVIDLADRHHPPYLTLSYCWGTQPANVSVTCDGVQFCITPTLDLALRRLRGVALSTNTPVWADQLCINQSDVVEKSRQVGMMDRVYTQCQSVVIYLGEEDGLSVDAFALLEQIYQTVNPDPRYDRFIQTATPEPLPPRATTLYRGCHYLTRHDWELLSSIYNRPWFYRAWIVQELILSPTAGLCCGRYWFSWRALAGIFASIETDFAEHGTSPGFDPDLVPNLFTVTRLHRRIYLRRSDIPEERKTLLDWLEATTDTRATDLRDKVYSLYGLASDRHLLPDPDYGLAAHEVHFAIALVYIQQGRLRDILRAANCSRDTTGLPSWCRFWTIMESAGGEGARSHALPLLLHYPKSPAITYSLDKTNRILSVAGIVVDEIAECSLPCPTSPAPMWSQRIVFWLQTTAAVCGQLRWPEQAPSPEEWGAGVSAVTPLLIEVCQRRGLLANTPETQTGLSSTLIRLMDLLRYGWQDETEFLSAVTDRGLGRALDPPFRLDEVIFARAIFYFERHFAVARTCKGRVALASKGGCEKGQLVVFLRGHCCLHLLSSDDEGPKEAEDMVYQLFEPCYVMGLMDGEELMSIPADEMKMIKLK